MRTIAGNAFLRKFFGGDSEMAAGPAFGLVAYVVLVMTIPLQMTEGLALMRQWRKAALELESMREAFAFFHGYFFAVILLFIFTMILGGALVAARSRSQGWWKLSAAVVPLAVALQGHAIGSFAAGMVRPERLEPIASSLALPGSVGVTGLIGLGMLAGAAACAAVQGRLQRFIAQSGLQ